MTDPNLIPPSEFDVYKNLPEGVRRTLRRSYDDHVKSPGPHPGAGPTEVAAEYRAGFPDKIAGALADAWYQFGVDLTKHPETFWHAVRTIPAASLNIVVIIYERMVEIDPALWEQIKWIRCIWVVSSAGFKCEYMDRTAMPALYSAMAGAICMDTKGIFQDGSGKKELLGGGQEHPGCDTWREVPKGGAPWGLHLLVGNRALVARSESVATLNRLDIANRSLDEVHLDWTDPVNGFDSAGYCSYDYVKSGIHLAQVKSGAGIPPSPFYAPEDLNAIKSLIGKLRRKNPSLDTRYQTQHESLERKVKSLNLIELACKGYSGWVQMDNAAAREIQKLLTTVTGIADAAGVR